MLAKRIIPCLDVKNKKLVKGTNFENLQELGDAVDYAIKYDKMHADELVFLDITASIEERKNLKELVFEIAKIFLSRLRLEVEFAVLKMQKIYF